MIEDSFGDAHNKVFVSFSGGKDSVATFLKCLETYPKEIIELVFCDTGDELPDTYEYLKYFHENVHPITRLTQKVVSRTESGRRSFKTFKIPVDYPVVELRKNYHTVYQEIRERFNSNPTVPPFPSNGIRHCTKSLKVAVFNKYVRNKVDLKDRFLTCVAIGLRQQESNNRKNTPETAIDAINGWDIWYPIYDFSLDDVLKIHSDNNIKVNSTYLFMDRSNCVGCSFAKLGSIKKAVDRYGEEIIEEWIKLEDETGYTFKNNKSIRDYKDEDDVVLEIEEKCSSGFCEF